MATSAGDGDGGEGAEVEGAGDDEDDEPVPEVGAVGDFAEVDDGGVDRARLMRPWSVASIAMMSDAGDDGDGDAAFDGVEVDH